MTDKLSSDALVEKTYVFISGLTRECRKGLTAKFEKEHRGIPAAAIQQTLQKETEAWFNTRDRNIKLELEAAITPKPGEVRLTYKGATKDAHFKIHVDTQFTIVEPGAKAYLKNLNLNVDKREFIK